MIITDITKEKFDEISKTGYQVIILRDIDKCDCLSKPVEDDNVIVPQNDILGIVDEIETADPNCPKCLGTGRKLFPILTNKIRVTTSEILDYFEKQLLELLKDNQLNFYFPYNYSFLSLKDYIAIPKMDSKNNIIFPIEYTDIYKISNIDMFVRNEFKFYKVSCKKKKVI